jgi:hypothetical protein
LGLCPDHFKVLGCADCLGKLKGSKKLDLLLLLVVVQWGGR